MNAYDDAAHHFYGDYARPNDPNRTPTEYVSKNTKASKYRGVTPFEGKYMAKIQHKKQRYYLGIFATEQEAALAYNRKAVELKGKYVRLNDVGG